MRKHDGFATDTRLVRRNAAKVRGILAGLDLAEMAPVGWPNACGLHGATVERDRGKGRAPKQIFARSVLMAGGA